jgi:hypothetical protein|nr:MAG TPA: hypothetical protein [Caudoviricetes sp.]
MARFGHQLVASLPEHQQQRQQRLEREHQWQLEQQQLLQLVRGAPRFDGMRDK